MRALLRQGLLARAVLFAIPISGALSTPALAAAAPAPGLRIHSLATPTSFSSQDNERCLATLLALLPACDSYQVTVTNAGSRPTDASTITLADTVPPGVTVRRASLVSPAEARLLKKEFGLEVTDDSDLFPLLETFGFCSKVPVQCSLSPPLSVSVLPDETLEMNVYVTVDEPGTPGALTNSATVSGGGAPQASTSAQNELAGPSPGFGASALGFYAAGLDGQPYTQAAGHPYELSTRIDMRSAIRQTPDASVGATSVKDVKDVVVDLPLGFLGSALSTPQCTFAELSSHISKGVGGCPPGTVVGHLLTEPNGTDSVNGPIYNMVPEHGVAAEFGFVDNIAGSHVLYARVVPGPNGYVLQVSSPDVPQVSLSDIVATFYGNPAARQQELAALEGKSASGIPPTAAFTMPSDCSGQPLTATVHLDSWQTPGRENPDGTPDLSDPNWASATSSADESPPLAGCNLLQFNPQMSAQPDTSVADSPTGLSFDLSMPQSEDPGTLATPPLKDAVVTLPPGLTVNPSAAGGLGACSPAQIALSSASEPTCPDSSKIGTVALTTPLIAGTLSGSIYLATQYENPFHSLLAGYIVVDDPTTGVVVKIPGEILPDEHTGQITGVFDNNPQFPFSDLKLHFKGGSRGALATPENCGLYSTTSALTPWSAPGSGPLAAPSDSFAIDAGCVSGFSPSFSAGTTNTHAGAYSPFVLSFSRSDTDQELSGLSVSLPPGMLAKVAGVTLCSDAALAAAASNPSGAAEAVNPSCPAGSLLGTVQAGAGPGPTPFFASGKAYLTGPYKGAPYGLAVVVPAIAGPFDLGNVVVRSSLQIDPTDGHVTATSDAFPTILKGIPLRLQRVDVTLDRERFTFNPTSCDPMAINAMLTSTTGATAPVSSRFQASGCRELPFKPHFAASAQGHTSKANGASLSVDVAQSPGEAGIRKVEVQLPLALPSRLTTLQKACTEAQFNQNPAGCPEGSNVGTATANTPILNVPLTGPAYLVSHGSAAFPDLEFVLQGEGVKIVLDGKTDIKKGITYSRFDTVPDAPISSFKASFPEGPHSVLAANGNLCAPTKTVTVKKRVTLRAHGKTRHVLRSVKKTVRAPLLMPTAITGQSGALLKQSTRIKVTGCAKPKATAKKRAKPHKRKHK
jgi:uncharacterized repeat protein (TIGR01451 family)